MFEPVRNRWQFLALFVALATSSLSAQKMGSIDGVVRDEDGATVPDVVVVAKAMGSDQQQDITNSSGQYALYPLPAGTYTVSFSAHGFRSYEIEQAEVRSDRTLTLNAQMQIGLPSETITVGLKPKDLHYHRISYATGKVAPPPPAPVSNPSVSQQDQPASQQSANAPAIRDPDEYNAYLEALRISATDASGMAAQSAALEKFIANYPNSVLLSGAKQNRDWDRSRMITDPRERAAALDKFIADYPDSELLATARILAINAREEAAATATFTPPGVSAKPAAQSPAPIDRGLQPAEQAPAAAIPHGAYYALVIGIDRYTALRQLRTAVQDARSIDAILRQDYGFQTKLLLDSDASRSGIMTALSWYKRTLSADDNLLIYYAGHGIHDREADRVFWLPVNAELENYENWLLTDDITSVIRGIPARHVLVIADSCYSGGMTRDIGPVFNPVTRIAFLEKMAVNKSRDLLSSGGDEPVADTGGSGGHSIFASALLYGLQNMSLDVFTAGELFANYIRVQVAGHSSQAPEYNFIRDSGHDAGDFIFTRGKR